MRLLRSAVLLFVFVLPAAWPAAASAQDIQAPSAPGAFTATASSGQVALHWNASTDNVRVVGYNVWRRDNPGSNWTEIKQVSTLTYTDAAVTAGHSYAYAARAYDAAGNVSNSSAIIQVKVPTGVDTTPPAAPTGLTATSSVGLVSLNWAASTDNVGVAKYDVWRRDDPGTNWVQIAQPPSSTYTDTTVTAGSGYAYEVDAYDAAGNVSAFSNVATATVPSASGTVLWKGDGELPLDQEWAEYSTAAHCAVTSNQVTSDPEAFRESSVVAQGASAYEFDISSADNGTCYGGARTEIGQGLPEEAGFSESRRFNQGDDRWFSFQVRLSSNFPVGNINWDNIAQWKQNPSTTVVPVPMVTMQVHNGAFYLEHAQGTANSNATTASTRLATATTDRWVKMSWHIKFSTDPSLGFVEVYGDPDGTGMRQLLPPLHFSTLATDGSGNWVPSNSRIGIYRSTAIPGTASDYYDGYTVADTRATAEANAFAP